MPRFQQRSDRKELLDRNDLPFADIRQNMQELDTINHRLGGHRITLAGLRSLTSTWLPDRPLRVVEIGCGGGDNLRVVRNWAEKKGWKINLCGIDLNPECIAFARSRPSNHNIHFLHSDYRTALLDPAPDIIFSSLFCHHFSNDELVSMLLWLKDHTTTGFFINDLHRHPLAYYSIKALTNVFSRSYLVRNDAPISVLRGFTRDEWKQLMNRAGIRSYTCRWRWAFRWLITYQHESERSF